MYILSDKNFLISKNLYFYDIDSALLKLQELTFNRINNYNRNIYVIEIEDIENSNLYDLIYANNLIIYYSDGNNIYKQDIHNNSIITIHTNKFTDLMGIKYLIPYTNEILNNSNPNDNLVNKEKTTVEEMDIIIKNKENDNIIINSYDTSLNPNKKVTFNDNSINTSSLTPIQNTKSTIEVNSKESKESTDTEKKEKREKEEELLKMCEDVMELYHKELSKVKKLEINLKSYDNKLNKLEKQKKEKIINNIIKTHSEYQTWKKLKYVIDDENDIFKSCEDLNLSNNDNIPIMFLSKFDYIDKINANDGIKNIFSKINLIDLNKLYTENTLPENEIIQFCDKYVKLSKELHYKFDHEWDYLDSEMNMNSTNKLIN